MSIGCALVVSVGLSIAAPALADDLPPGWIADRRTGCRVWNYSPQPEETVAWSGACVNGLADGEGTLTWYDGGTPGVVYTGSYRAGHMHGHGVLTMPDGNRYAGQWQDDRPHGEGSYRFADGEVFAGSWTRGCFRQGGRTAWLNASARECGFE